MIPMIRLTLLAAFCVSAISAEPLDPAVISKPPEVGAGYRLPISKQGLGINAKNGRQFYIPLRLDGRRAIKVTIWHGHDNTGDGGLRWRLLDTAKNKEIAHGFTKSKKAKSWTIRDISSLKPVLIIEDADSKFSGKAPGNGFSIAVSRAK